MKCEDAGQVCDKNQYGEASFWEKLKLKVHLFYCRTRREYSKKNDKLSIAFKKSNLKIMSLQDKEDLKEQIHQEITK